jgi:hypothetical protein
MGSLGLTCDQVKINFLVGNLTSDINVSIKTLLEFGGKCF